MNTRMLMTLSTACLGLLGIALLFFPQEAGGLIPLGPDSELSAQMAAAGFLAIAVLDWAGRGAVYGGIFGRPIVLANLMLGMVCGGSILGTLRRGGGTPSAWGLAAFFLLYVALYASLLFRSPSTETS